MKLNTAFLFLFLIISITSENSWDSYSIEPFKEELKNEGLLEIIESILKAYNQDVAILSCEELVGNRKGNCKRLVIEYMDPYYECSPPTYCKKAKTRGLEDYKIKCIEKLIYSKITNSQNQKNSFAIKMKLRKKFTKDQSDLIFNKIANRVRHLGSCKE